MMVCNIYNRTMKRYPSGFYFKRPKRLQTVQYWLSLSSFQRWVFVPFMIRVISVAVYPKRTFIRYNWIYGIFNGITPRELVGGDWSRGCKDFKGCLFFFFLTPFFFFSFSNRRIISTPPTFLLQRNLSSWKSLLFILISELVCNDL